MTMIADDENQNGDGNDGDTWLQHNNYNAENQKGGEDHTWAENKATKKAKQNNHKNMWRRRRAQEQHCWWKCAGEKQQHWGQERAKQFFYVNINFVDNILTFRLRQKSSKSAERFFQKSNFSDCIFSHRNT